MKILWASNAPWAATGYGQQTAMVVPRIRDAGHDIAIFASYGLNGATQQWGDIVVYPAGFDAYGNDVIAAHALDWLEHPNNGWLITLYDAWVYEQPAIVNFHNAVWCPVDHQPLPPKVEQYFRRFQGVPIAMSQFGVQQFARRDIEALYVPHGVDPVYQPKDQKVARQALGLPEDAFVVGMNAANKGGELHRKGFGPALVAFSQFAKHHDDAILYLHTEQYGHARGWNLDALVERYGIKDRVVFADQYAYRQGIPIHAMPWLYSSFDVFLNPSLGEGFGIPIVEAQACGVPVIVSNWTSMPELVGHGWLVGGERYPHESMQSDWLIPNVGEIVDALGDAYDLIEGPSARAVDFAAAYETSRVFDDYWRPVLVNLSERIHPVAA